MAESQANDNNTCVVCFKNVLYYSIGECDHPVCFECSTRMRVLCQQNECPICRHVLSRVVFTATILPYKELRNRVFTDRLFERQFKIGYCTEEIKQAYDFLLENKCKICKKLPPFRVFSMLSDHMRREHERFFCDLCSKNLKIFTSERKYYTREELALHRRKGDVDDTSHRGHPLCEFCEERFMDMDELYRHLRKEHLYCHLCDADGKNLYYASHNALAHHFRKDHYLCEEGECAGQHLTAVFRSEIDLKAHKATVHGRGLTRGAARQARTLELQFNITPHPGAARPARGQPQPERVEEEPLPAPSPLIDTRSDAQFPRLSAAAPAPLTLAMPRGSGYRGTQGLTRNDKNFPALDGAPAPRAPPPRPSQTVAATVLRNSKPGVSIQVHSQPASASNFRLTPATNNRASQRRPLSDDDFPTLGPRDDYPSLGAGTVQPPKVAMINSQEMQAMKSSQQSSAPKKQPLSSEAFPALTSSSAPSAPPQWITVAKPKEKPKRSEPPPPKHPTFNPIADFPTLPANLKTKNKKPQAQPQQAKPTAPVQEKQTKKEKKKQNAKKENIIDVPQVNGSIDKKMAREMSFGTSANNNSEDKKIKSLAAEAIPEKSRNGGNGDFALAAKDYPPLSLRSENVAPLPVYPPQSSRKANGVPPGFKPRPPCDGMTFTNSAGQTFPAPLHTYIQPPDFEARNRALVQKFAVALGGAEAVEDFRVASRAFRDNITSAEEFYEHCRMAMGAKLEPVFPELVALLPDIVKQQELAVGRDVTLAVCATCGQLLAPQDHIAHDAAHWPALNSR